MCIIIHKPRGVLLGRRLFQACWDSNPDGAGFMFAHRGRLVVRKGFFEFKEFWSAYRKAIQGEARGSDVILHFRVATRGRVNAKNCHPHRVGKALAFAHNGTFAIKVPADSPVSDSILFRDQVLGLLAEGDMEPREVHDWIEDRLGRGKLAFMNRRGEVTIIHRDLGVEDRGCWFSNLTYRIPRWSAHVRSLAISCA